jgi:hypothetical protein
VREVNPDRVVLGCHGDFGCRGAVDQHLRGDGSGRGSSYVLNSQGERFRVLRCRERYVEFGACAYRAGGEGCS